MSSGTHSKTNKRIRAELDEYVSTLQPGTRVCTPSLAKQFEKIDNRRRLCATRMGKICMGSQFLKLVKWGVWERV